ncbi:MAG TPA: DNA methyltransferase [Polyangia bacterium]|nr:DNA methyltransferase [Polyangia bacterium]
MRGAPAAAEKCARAFGVPPGDDGRADVHGFHVYPARMHPRVAAALVATFSAPGELVLDPFCGSGTVLAEAIAAGRRALGMDLNPLAALLAGFKARPWTAARAQAMLTRARAVVAQAASAHHDAPRDESEWFEPHMLRELANLRGQILREPAGEARTGLELILSSILTKLSRQSSDTRIEKTRKQLARGFASRLYLRKAAELAERLSAYGQRVVADTAAARVLVGDARRLDGVGASTVALVVTSPPYRGVFDYLRQHERRARWLGLDLAPLLRGEMGARRDRDRGGFADDMLRALRALARVLRPGGQAALVTGDDALVRLAPSAGLRFVAAATQPRPQGRREHLLLLEKPR